jgi:hypothetical protein
LAAVVVEAAPLVAAPRAAVVVEAQPVVVAVVEAPPSVAPGWRTGLRRIPDRPASSRMPDLSCS